LVAALLAILPENKLKYQNKNFEKEILINGMERKYPFYAIGVPEEFCKKTREKIVIYVDNKYFTKVLSKIATKNIKVVRHKINEELITKVLKKSPCICHIDDNLLGDYSHVSHFIVLQQITKNGIKIMDPYYGKESLISIKKLEEAIKSLKSHVKMCPLLITLK